MIKTETAKKYGGTKVIPLSEFDFIVPGKRYIIQDADIDSEKCIIIKEDKETKLKLNKIEDRPDIFFEK